jgi:hypothetical protein
MSVDMMMMMTEWKAVERFLRIDGDQGNMNEHGAFPNQMIFSVVLVFQVSRQSIKSAEY